MATGPATTRVVIAVDDEHVNHLHAVAARLRDAGMTVSQILPDLGVISGSIDPARMGALSQIEGVANVEPAYDVHLPPPDSPVQ